MAPALSKYSPEHFHLRNFIRADANNMEKLFHKRGIVTENIARLFQFQILESGRPLPISLRKSALVELVLVGKVIMKVGTVGSRCTGSYRLRYSKFSIDNKQSTTF